MAQIRPFRGVRFDPQKVGDLSKVVAPPYDVISPAEQQALYQLSPHNVVRLELPLDLSGDDPQENRHTRAALTLRQWLSEGVLLPEAQPALYPYEQSFDLHGQTFVRRSLFTRLRLAEWSESIVFPHESTFPKPKEDRLALLRACQANISPVFALYEDPNGEAQQLLADVWSQSPAIDLTDEVGVRHRLWVLTDPHQLDAIAAWFARQRLYIADGHHRYETALEYRRTMRATTSEGSSQDNPWQYVMTVLCAREDPGLVVLPTHRLVRGIPEQLVRLFPIRLAERFNVEPIPLSSGNPAEAALRALADLKARKGESPPIGVYGLDGERLLRLTPRDEMRLQEMMPQDRSTAWRRLGVAILHEGILEPLLAVTEQGDDREGMVSYTRDAAEAIRAVDEGRAQLAFFLGSVRVAEIRDVALAGDVMPHKTTYFYPKLLTGLVLYVFATS